MSLHTDLSDDHVFFDGVETVSLDPAAMGEPTINNIRALRRNLSFDEVHSMSYQVGDVAWHLWASFLGGYVPMAGDVLTDAGGQDWTVLDCALATADTRFRLVCRKA